ncbi:MAG: hypothetical protein Greene041619_1173 [Candidatus Peregrinibacteria bacterium Greene0416_19]|nr:MAG: hypothetical protein Greene041619_1173 [Candidatus Peregrinibacteria bacterium Greene0416_19]
MKLKSILSGICLLFLGLLWTHGAEIFAIPAAAAQELGGLTSSTISGLALIVGLIITVLDVLMWLLFLLLELVMDPSFIFSAGLLRMLQEVWQFSRDLVNVGFAILLIVGAVWTVVTANTEKVKTMLPKFVILVVVVNFSWFIPRVIFDVAQIAAYTVFQIPSMLNAPACSTPSADGRRLEPCRIVTNLAFFGATQTIPAGAAGWQCPLPGLVCYQSVPVAVAVAGGATPRTVVISGLVVNHARLGNMGTIMEQAAVVNNGQGPDIGTLLVFIVKMAIILVLHVALVFPLLAMIVAFFIRIPVLWFTIAFMPFVALGIMLEGKLPGNFDVTQQIGWRYVKAAFLPAFVAVPFAVGFIMLNAAMQMAPPSGLFATPVPLIAGVTNLWQLLWMLIALFIMWTGVFSILKQDEITGKFSESMKGIGMATMKLPAALPILPWKGADGRNMSISQGLKSIDPRNMAPNGVYVPHRQRAGAPDQPSVQRGTQAIHNDNTLRGNIDVHIRNITDAMPAPQVHQHVNRAIQAAQLNPTLSRLPRNEIVEAIIQGLGNLSTRRQQQIRDNMNPPAANPPPANPPAANPPPANPPQPNP